MPASARTFLVQPRPRVCGLRRDGRFGFTRVHLRFDADADPADLERAQKLAAKAEETCLVLASLDCPVEAAIEVHPDR